MIAGRGQDILRKCLKLFVSTTVKMSDSELDEDDEFIVDDSPGKRAKGKGKDTRRKTHSSKEAGKL